MCPRKFVISFKESFDAFDTQQQIIAQSWPYAESSSAAGAHHRGALRLSAGSQARRCRLEQYGRSRARPNMNSDNSRRRWRTIPSRSHSGVLAFQNVYGAYRKVFRSKSAEDRRMGRSQALPSRTIHRGDAAISVTCPNCKTTSMFKRPTIPQIDSCGFESHSFRREWCVSFLAGIIAPIDGKLLVSLLEQASGATARPSDPSSGRHDLQCNTRFHGTEEQSSSQRD